MAYLADNYELFHNRLLEPDDYQIKVSELNDDYFSDIIAAHNSIGIPHFEKVLQEERLTQGDKIFGFPGESMLLTEYGYCELRQLYKLKAPILIWNGSAWSKITLYRCDPQRVINVFFSNGTSVMCLPTQEVIVDNGPLKTARRVQLVHERKW